MAIDLELTLDLDSSGFGGLLHRFAIVLAVATQLLGDTVGKVLAPLFTDDVQDLLGILRRPTNAPIQLTLIRIGIGMYVDKSFALAAENHRVMIRTLLTSHKRREILLRHFHFGCFFARSWGGEFHREHGYVFRIHCPQHHDQGRIQPCRQ